MLIFQCGTKRRIFVQLSVMIRFYFNYLKEDFQMGHYFSFFPFGALFCFTLLCFVAVRVFEIRYRYRDRYQHDRLLKSKVDKEDHGDH